MSYADICPIFQARFDENMRFLFKSREEMEEEDEEIIKRINETPAQKAAKRRKLNEEAQKAEALKKQLEIVHDEDDDVFTEATPLGRKVPVVDYEIVMINNKPSESEDISDGECDLPLCDDFPKSHLVTFSNPLVDIDNDFTSSDDESFFEDDVPMENFKIFYNPLFDLDEEIISAKVNPIQNEVIDEADFDPEGDISLIERLLYVENSIESFPPSHILVEDSDPFMEEIDLFLAFDGSIPSGIDSDYSDSEGDNLFRERLLHDDPIPILDILDFSNVVRFFLPFFTYPVISSILLSSGSEDTIFDPNIFNYHFSSLKQSVSHQSGTFVKLNVYPNHLNKSPMEILSSTYFPMDQ
nr:hypothetical protein [Tanacetum cinerariifolium]